MVRHRSRHHTYSARACTELRSSFRAAVAAESSISSRHSALAGATAAGLISFVVFAALAARDVAFGDGPELTAAAITNGVAHPPGYPLWIVLGHLASLAPLGTLPFRVNLTACAYHAVTVGFVFASAYVLTRRLAAALFAALALAACSPIFVSWSLQAEVFSLDDAFAAAIVFVCILWLQAPARWIPPVLGALFGFGLSNHQSLVLLLPVALWAAYANRDWMRRDPRAPLLLASGAALALATFFLPYAHTLAASQAHVWHFGTARTPGELRDLILRRAYGGFNLVARTPDQGGSMWQRLGALAVADGWPLAASIFGAIAAFAAGERRAATIAALLVAFPLVAFCAVANVDVHDELLRAVFTRFGLLSLTALAPFAAYLALRPVLGWACCALAVASAIVTLPPLSLRNEHGPRTLFADIFRALPRNAVLVTAGDPVDQPPQYFQSVEGMRTDVTIVTYGLLDYAPYVGALSTTLAVPAEVGMNYAPAVRRDVLIAANPGRPFFVAGERGIHAPGPRYRPEVLGVTSAMVLTNAPEQLVILYRRQTGLESAPGYGDVPAARWATNGMGAAVREYYAGGFFSTGLVAERLGDSLLARSWYEKARTYYDDPVIAAKIGSLGR
ncbi:MAG: DUF2723 domain-containing protein [Candidatus Eremiobacteraeota bacterium]|nr:DUF2723 domain-containing protein [Candidatus Eremiobacteraeota bacterium]